MKKNLFLITALCFLCISMLNAQVNKGKILLGLSTSSNNFSNYYLAGYYMPGSSNLMSIGFSTLTSKNNTVTGTSEKIRTFNLIPKVGYFIVDNLVAGFDITFYSMSSRNGFGKETLTELGIGPFVRYFLPIGKIAPFFEVGGTFGSLSDKYVNSPNEQIVVKSSINSFIGGIGLAVPISNMVKFDLMGGYFSTSTKDKTNNENNQRTILSTFAIKLGFLLYLGANQ